MSLSLAYSPCPNDTFMFEALVHKRIKGVALEFMPQLHDIELLNKLCLEGRVDLCKISVRNFVNVADEYCMLRSGAALGRNCGPLVITKNKLTQEQLLKSKIAIPGKNTTANLLLGIFYPDLTNKTELLFSDIEDAVAAGEFDAGLIIHESRFTYDRKGLKKHADLGELWEKRTQMPLPLGCIVARRDLGKQRISEIESAIAQSVQFAVDNPEISMPYVRKHAQEMDDEVMKQHIQLYVNDFSVDLGELGVKAVDTLLELGVERNILHTVTQNIFA